MKTSIKLFGTTQPAPERQALRAGPVTLDFEAGGLRYIRVGGVEAVRAIAFLVRDKVWGTANPRIVNLEVETRGEGFHLTFDAECRTTEGEITWSGEVTGTADGTITFNGVARPATDFETGRTGFVILHPINLVAGQALAVTDADDQVHDEAFPAEIDPDICLTNIRGLRYRVTPGLDAVCRMDGNVPWEMEDQRNWTDASFKTYVRPMTLPFPYIIPGGSEDRQSVRLGFEGEFGSGTHAEPDGPIEVALGEPMSGEMPAIGISAPVRWLDRAGEATAIARALGPQYLHARFDPVSGHSQLELSAFRDLAAAVGAPLMLEITASCANDPEAELATAKALMADLEIEPAAIVVVPALHLVRLEPTDPGHPEDVARIYAAARKIFSDRLLGGGVFGFFAELNRTRLPSEKIDFITNITSALVHAPDDESVMETLEAIPHLVRSAGRIAPGKPYWLGPANIGLDESPNGPTAENPDNERVAIARMDPRHRGLFGAAFTAGLIAEAARADIATIVSAALVGELGVAYTRTSYSQPGFDERPGACVYPIYHVLRGFARAAGKPRVEAISQAPARVRSIAYLIDGVTELWLANITNAQQKVIIPNLADLSWCRLDEANFEAATSDPDFFETADALAGSNVDLGPYALARIRVGG